MNEATLLAWLPTLIALLAVAAMWGRMNQNITTLQSTVVDLKATTSALEEKIEDLMSKEQCARCQSSCKAIVDLRFTSGAQDIGALKQQLNTLGEGIHRLEINQAVAHAAGRREVDRDQFIDFTATPRNGGLA